IFRHKGKVLLYSLCLSEAVLSHRRRSHASLGAHYIARYSLCLREGIGPTFAQDIICAVDICRDDAPVFRAIESVSPSNALSAKDMFFFIVRIIDGYFIQVKQARLTGIGLFGDLDLDAN